MVSTVIGGPSEGELGGHLMENPGRLTCDILPKYKRRKVSAVRDFPPGCGRFALQINLAQKGAIATVDNLDNLVGGDNTDDVLRNDCLPQSPRVAESSNPTEPIGQIKGLDYKEAQSSDTLNQVDGHESIGAESLSQMPKAFEGLDGRLEVSELETSDLSRFPHQVKKRASEEHMIMSADDAGLNGNGHLKVPGLETPVLLKDPYEVNNPASGKHLIQPSSLDAGLIVAPKGNGLEKHPTKDYPPRRRVSAIRDFPPFCGRNAPCVSGKSSELVASSKTKIFAQLRIDVDNNSIEEAKKIGSKEMGEDIQGGDAHKNELEENDLNVSGDESQAEQYKTEAMGKLDEFTTASRMQEAQGDAINKSIKPPCESNHYCRDETVVENDNMDVEDLDKNIEKKVVVDKKNGFKRKLSDVSGPPEQLQEEDWEAMEVASRRMIVQGLRAAPNSLEKQDKMSHKLNPAGGGSSKIKGKKHVSLEKSKFAAKRTTDKSKDSGVKSMKTNSPTGKCESHNTEEMRKQDKLAASSKVIVLHGDAREKCFELSNESNQYCRDETVVEKGKMDVGSSPRNAGKEIVIYAEKRSPVEISSDISGSQGQLQEEVCEGLEIASDRVIVHALSAGASGMGRLGKTSYKPNPVRKKKDKSKDFGGKSVKIKSPTISNTAQNSTSQLIVSNPDYSEDDEEIDEFHVAVRSRKFDLCLPPFGHSDPSKSDEHDGVVTRNKVRETLRLFQAICRKLLQEEETKAKEPASGTTRRRIDLAAARILKDKGKYVNTGKQLLGSVPGIEVGDEFHYRVELNLIGLHRQIQGGIDYVKQGREIIATSIVASGGYADELDNSDFLIYTGQGGNMMGGDKEPEDQKLERGNLALKNSISAKNPVRVIRGFKETKASDSSDARGRPAVIMTYIYDGLYLVEKSWQEEGNHGKLVYKFRLVRIPGQPELAWKQLKKSDKSKVREGLCDNDISRGKEIIPICAVNTIDDEKPPPFEYITHTVYPDWCRPIPPKGCDCTKKCLESEKCSCAVMNGGEIPYNYNGAIVEAKPLVYECGPLCKCPPSCPNRVSQRGIKFPLEIFKTESRGWGVRSLNSISSGSFICEYVGELLEGKEAEERTGNDEYLFDIGNNYNDTTLWGGLSTLMPDAHSVSSEIMEDDCFTIDAARCGNIGRFINHSCSPNLYAQNVLYDHEDKRVPHIMFFAAENIPPLQELTYHYNYTIDQVRDSNGNIKQKSCYCGAADCTGRMY